MLTDNNYYDRQIRNKTESEKQEAPTLNLLFSDFLLHCKNRVKPSTYARYYSIVHSHLCPHLGSLTADQLTAPQLDAFADRILREGRLNGGGALSPKRVRDILSVLRSALFYAQIRGDYHHTIHISSPRLEMCRVDILTREEEQRLITYVIRGEEPLSFGVLLSLYTGIRIGELCALKWTDINWSEHTLSITKTLQRIADINGTGKTKIVIDTPKSKSSEREIPLPHPLMCMLKERYRSAHAATSYLLTGNEQFIEPSNYYIKYQHWLAICGLPHHSFHALRHTFATRCIENGFDPKSLSEILGHSTVNITLSRYVHPSMEIKRQNMERITKYLASQFAL